MNLTKLLVCSITLLFISAIGAHAALLYDVDGNGKVDIGDLVIIRQHYNEITGSPYPSYDVNSDGVVDVRDATLVGQHIRKVTPGMSISSGDGLNLMLGENGAIDGISIDDTSLPMLATRGGFSFREVLTNAPNLLSNPGFEDGAGEPLNWSLQAADGNIPSWDSISHSGARSIKISLPTEGNSGYPMSDKITAEPMQYYTFSAWGKTDGAAGTNVPAVRVAELDSNRNWITQTNLYFSDGTSDWTQKKFTFRTGINTKYLYVYANIWDGYGTFWLDDVELSPFFGPTTYLNGAFTQKPDGTVTQKARANDIDFTLYYIPKGRYIELQGEMQDLRGEDRTLQVMYNLPVNLTGWYWNDEGDSRRVVSGGANYENLDINMQNKYSFASVYGGRNGLSVAVSPTVFNGYRTNYNTLNGYGFGYDFSVKNLNKTKFELAIYSTDGEFNTAEEKYYEIYPVLYSLMDKVIYVYGVTNISRINAVLDNVSLLLEVSPKVWLLRVPLVVKEQGALYINSEDVDELRLLSMNDSNVSFLKVLGKGEIEGVKVTSWNEKENIPGNNTDYYRAYILAKGKDAELKLINSNINYLGNGLIINYYIRPEENGIVMNNVNNGLIENSTFKNIGDIAIMQSSNVKISNVTVFDPLTYGIYIGWNNYLCEVKDSRIINSTMDGIILGWNTTFCKIINNTVLNSGTEGITVITSSNYNLFEDNTIDKTNNEGFDIEFSNHNIFRRNYIANANYDGYFFWGVENTTIEDSISNNNLLNGIQLWNSFSVLIRNNSFSNNFWNGINLARVTHNVSIVNNRIAGESGIQLIDASSILIDNNKLNQIKYPYTFGYQIDGNSNYALEIIFRNTSINPTNDFSFYTSNVTYSIQ